MKSSERIKWVDLARAAAIVSVVLCHATESVYTLNKEGLAAVSRQSGLFAIAAFTLGRIGVPIFLFITGYLLLTKTYDSAGCIRFYKKSFLPLLLTSEIWIVLFSVIQSRLNGEALDILRILKRMVFVERLPFNHTWYIPMILGMYLFIPFVAKVLSSFDKKVFLLPFFVTIIYAFAVPTIYGFQKAFAEGSVPSNLRVSFGDQEYGLYIVAGFFMYSCKKSLDKIATPVLIAVSIISFSVVVVFQAYLYINANGYNVWYNNIFLLICGVSLFLLLSRSKKACTYRVFYSISKYSFGIYLCHFPIQEIFLHYISLNLKMPINVLLLTVIVFAVSFLFVSLLSRIPKVGRWLFFLK